MAENKHAEKRVQVTSLWNKEVELCQKAVDLEKAKASPDAIAQAWAAADAAADALDRASGIKV